MNRAITDATQLREIIDAELEETFIESEYDFRQILDWLRAQTAHDPARKRCVLEFLEGRTFAQFLDRPE